MGREVNGVASAVFEEDDATPDTERTAYTIRPSTRILARPSI
jgi:hypothetical protein